MKTHHVEMHSVSPSSKRRQVATRVLLLLPTTLASSPLVAQQPRADTVVVRTVSSWQVDVDRLKEQLVAQRSLEQALFRMLAEVEMRKLSAVPDSQRYRLQAESQLLVNRMQEASMEERTIRRKIETLCATARKPKGWLGVATTGVQLKEQRGDGTTYIRFLELPTVASVDPGSPAERVGVRAGDVLLEIGGQQLLQTSLAFAELLQPGKEIAIKLKRDGDTFTLMPTIEPLPEVTTTPCAWVEPAMAYLVRPMPAQAPRVVRVETGPGRYSYAYARQRRDTSVVATTATAGGSGGVMAGPMVSIYTGGANSLAGVQLVALSTESSRALGVAHGILVNQVLPGTPGRNAGLQGGDILLSADSVDLRSIQQLQRVINNATDRVVTLMIVRDRKRETLQLKW